MRTAAIVVLSLAVSGCSWTMMQYPPQNYRRDAVPNCTQASDAPTYDFVIAGVSAVLEGVAQVVARTSNDPTLRQNADSGLIGFGIPVVFVISGLTGRSALSRCRKFTAQHDAYAARLEKQHAAEQAAAAAKHAARVATARKAHAVPFSIVVLNSYAESVFQLTARVPAAEETFGPWDLRLPALGKSSPVTAHARIGEPVEVDLVGTSLGDQHPFEWDSLTPPHAGATLLLTYSWDPALAKFRATAAWQ